jgi:hypothetical protein
MIQIIEVVGDMVLYQVMSELLNDIIGDLKR